MSPVNLSPARLAVLVALVVGGIAVLLNGFDTSTGTAVAGGTSPSPTAASPTSASPTQAGGATTTPKPQVEGVKIMVFNGTDTTGLGGTVQQMLEAKGYVKTADAQDAPSKPVTETTVYFKGGADSEQARSDAKHMATKYLHGAQVDVLGDDLDVPADTELVVVVGSDYPGATD
jgi:hypothetical protein